MIHGMLAAGGWQDRRGANLLDGGCPFYGTYETADGRYMAVGALEQQFYDEFVRLLGIEDDAPDPQGLRPAGPSCARRRRALRTRTRDGVDRPSSRAPTPAWPPCSPCARRPPTRTSPPAAPSPTTAASPSPPPHPASPPDIRGAVRADQPAPARPGAGHRRRCARDWDVRGIDASASSDGDGHRRHGSARSSPPDHEAFRETVRTFLAKEVLPHYEQWEKDGIVSREAWRAAGRQGLLGPRRPRGVRRRREHRLPLQRRARRGVHPRGRARARARPAQRHHRPLPDLARHRGAEAPLAARLLLAARLITAIAMTEPGAGSDLQGIRTTAEDRGDHWVLNGSKTFISNGILADLVIVVAKTTPEGGAHGLSLLVVERGMEGFERGRNLDKIGQKAQDTAELFFHDVRVPKENLLGELDGAFVHLMTNLAAGADGHRGRRRSPPPSTCWRSPRSTSRSARPSAGRCPSSSTSASRSRRWPPSAPSPAPSSTGASPTTRTANSTPCTPRWPSGGPPSCRSASPTAACNCTAATAT